MGRPIFKNEKDLEPARLKMLGAREALEDYEKRVAFKGSMEHTRLEREFSKATEQYLRLSGNQK